MLGQMLPSLGMTGAANAEGILPRTSTVLGPGPILFAQARVVEQHTIAQAVTQAMADGGAVGLLVVITGASHVRYGARGRGVPSKVVTKQKQKQVRGPGTLGFGFRNGRSACFGLSTDSTESVGEHWEY